MTVAPSFPTARKRMRRCSTKPTAVLFKDDSPSQAIASRGHFQGTPMRKLLALTAGALALVILTLAVVDYPAWSQAARTIRVVITVPPGGSIDISVPPAGGSDLKHTGARPSSSRAGRAPAVSSRPKRWRARRRRQHAPKQQQWHHHQRDPAEGELRSADQLRADLLPGLDSADRRRQQRVALSHAGRAVGRGPLQARRAVDCQRRAQHHPASSASNASSGSPEPT